MSGSSLSVSVLLTRAHAAMGLRCLGSLVRAVDRAVDFVVHDDGTLDPETIALLRERLPVRRVVRRSEADPKMDDALADFPECRAFRRRSPLALKLFDVAAFAEGPTLRYVDSDVLFLRRFCGADVFDSKTALFLMDCQSAYSIRSWQMCKDPSLALVDRVNTGVIVYPREAFDLRRLESFLATTRQRTATWVEQTCWARLAATVRTRLLSPTQFVVPRAQPLVGRRTVAVHFVTPVRGQLARAWRSPDPGDAPVRVGTVPARRWGPAAALRSESERLLRRIARGLPRSGGDPVKAVNPAGGA